jgi:hypothetical protein
LNLLPRCNTKNQLHFSIIVTTAAEPNLKPHFDLPHRLVSDPQKKHREENSKHNAALN